MSSDQGPATDSTSDRPTEDTQAADMASEEVAPGESTGHLYTPEGSPRDKNRERDEGVAAADLAGEEVSPGESTGHLYDPSDE